MLNGDEGVLQASHPSTATHADADAVTTAHDSSSRSSSAAEASPFGVLCSEVLDSAGRRAVQAALHRACDT